MNFETGIPEHIEDALVRMHTGQCFVWNGKEKIYADLFIHDDSKTKLTEEELNAKLVEIQNEFDDKENNKASTKAKLAALGLTEAEIKDTFGL